MKRILIFFALLLILLPVLPLTVRAQEDEQFIIEDKFTAIEDDYVIRFSPNPTELVAGEDALLSLSLARKFNLKYKDYDYVWVQIKSGDQVTLANHMAAVEPGKSSIQYVFPKAGDYKITARFFKYDSIIAEHVFDFQVKERVKLESVPEDNMQMDASVDYSIFYVVIGALVVAVLILLLLVFKKPRH